jgi:hypothetical protein
VIFSISFRTENRQFMLPIGTKLKVTLIYLGVSFASCKRVWRYLSAGVKDSPLLFLQEAGKMSYKFNFRIYERKGFEAALFTSEDDSLIGLRWDYEAGQSPAHSSPVSLR